MERKIIKIQFCVSTNYNSNNIFSLTHRFGADVDVSQQLITVRSRRTTCRCVPFRHPPIRSHINTTHTQHTRDDHVISEAGADLRHTRYTRARFFFGAHNEIARCYRRRRPRRRRRETARANDCPGCTREIALAGRVRARTAPAAANRDFEGARRG